jgi:hypothetical protein
MNAVVRAALAAREAGLSTVRVGMLKKPTEGWNRYQRGQASPSQVEAWFLTRTQRGPRFWPWCSVTSIALSETGT